MQIPRHLLTLGLIPLLILLAGCPKPPEPPPIVEQSKNYGGALPPGQVALVKLTDPSTFPDFSEGFQRRTGLEEAVNYSLEYLSRPSSQHFYPYLDITHERAVASLEAFLDVLHTARTPQEFDQQIKARFDIYQSRGYPDYQRSTAPWTPPDTGIVLYTGYYRPIFDARLQPDAEFKYPLYKKPPDLVQDPVTGTYKSRAGGPYLTRSEIDQGALAGKGLELCYLRDRFETYIVTVQGSGRLRLEDGSYFDIGYAGDNGHEYTSIGQSMVENREITPEELSLQGLIRYFQQHPEKLDEAFAINKRYVFFTPRGGGPYGSLNVPVTPFRSIATDKQVYPRAMPAYLVTQLPARGAEGITNHSYSGFAMDQDTGGAIRAAGRCDVFLGTGPEVGEKAGRTFAEGQLYYIAVKPGQATSGTGTVPMTEPPAEMPAEPSQQ